MRSFNPVLLSALAMLTLGDAPPPATATDERSPPNDLWPVRTHDAIRRGCYVLDVAAWARADWARAGLPRVGPSGPREAFDPLWDELVNWLAQCPVLVDIETFWVFDADHGHGWQLLVTGMPSAEVRSSAALRDAVKSGRVDEQQRANRKRRAARKRKRGWA